ncbi:MAG: class I SAM-dependent methyltransferase [Chitinophagaceae bacterium]|nr:class I SAM-dependent methyltransferase [Chitinophagaceae bacterium]
MNHFFLIKAYINYCLKAKSAHGIHSPFVFDFITNLLQDKRTFYAFDTIENYRQELYKNDTELNIEDFGAGSLKSNFKKRKISDIAKTAGRNRKMGELLFRMVNYFDCKNSLELGTSLGIGSHYLALANTNSKVVTIEGSKEIFETSKANFEKNNLKNIEQVLGNFDLVLDEVLEKNSAFDLIFIDGNHREEPTINYFKKCLSKINDNTILIFDDIHWSKGMQNAWESIKKDKAVTLSLDLFYFGIVFFRKEFKEKQHFVLKY